MADEITQFEMDQTENPVIDPVVISTSTESTSSEIIQDSTSTSLENYGEQNFESTENFTIDAKSEIIFEPQFLTMGDSGTSTSPYVEYSVFFALGIFILALFDFIRRFMFKRQQ